MKDLTLIQLYVKAKDWITLSPSKIKTIPPKIKWFWYAGYSRNTFDTQKQMYPTAPKKKKKTNKRNTHMIVMLAGAPPLSWIVLLLYHVYTCVWRSKLIGYNFSSIGPLCIYRILQWPICNILFLLRWNKMGGWCLTKTTSPSPLLLYSLSLLHKALKYSIDFHCFKV